MEVADSRRAKGEYGLPSVIIKSLVNQGLTDHVTWIAQARNSLLSRLIAHENTALHEHEVDLWKIVESWEHRAEFVTR